jgi:hypothetical protein
MKNPRQTGTGTKSDSVFIPEHTLFTIGVGFEGPRGRPGTRSLTSVHMACVTTRLAERPHS